MWEVEIIIGLVSVFVVIIANMVIGRMIFRVFFKKWNPFLDPVLSDIAAVAIGIMLLCSLLFAIIALKLVYRSILWAIIIGCATIAVPILVRWTAKVPAFLKIQNGGKLWTAAVGFYFLIAVILAALPPTLNDELIYHLAIPKTWLSSNSGFFFGNNIYAYFPQLGELFFLLGLGTAGESAARLFHTASAFLLFLAVYRAAVGIMDLRYARVAALALLSIPTSIAITSTAYVDLTFTLFVFLAILSMRYYLECRDLKHALFAGLMLGGAICVKYTGLQMTALAVCLLAICRLKTKDLPLGKAFAFVAGPTAAFALPWLYRNMAITGWPVFPFSIPFFRLNPGINWDPDRAELFLRFLQAFGAPLDGGTIWNTLTAPARVFVQARFDNPLFFDGNLGPVFLLAPIFLLMRKARKQMDLYIVFTLLFIFYWAFSTKQVRFLLPVMPFFCLFYARGFQAIGRPWAAYCAIFLISFNFFLGGKEISKNAPWDYLTGAVSRKDYIVRVNPVFSFYDEANQKLEAGNKLFLIHMRNYGYFLDHSWEGDFVFERYRLDQLLKSRPTSAEIFAFFKKMKVSHVLINLKRFSSSRTSSEKESVELFLIFLKEACDPLFERDDHGLFRINPAKVEEQQVLIPSYRK